jgi:preprotein translocase subunit SecF
MINWMKFRYFYFLLSALIIIPGVFMLVRYGFRLAIDFTGGTLLEVRLSSLPENFGGDKIQQAVKESGYDIYSVQNSGKNDYMLRMKNIDKNQADQLVSDLSTKFNTQIETVRFDTIGPTLGREILVRTLIGILLAATLILFYLGWQFKNFRFGACAVFAMIHDALVLLGTFAILGRLFGVEIDSLFVTAMLTILSFSVHDTVVVYDRIRESQRLYPRVAFDDLVNKSITETLNRSMNNSLTVVFMLTALVLLGGVTTKWFAVALLVGIISGTYSSTFTAAPLLVIWNSLELRRKKIK